MQEIWLLLKETFEEWRLKQVSLLAASLAYYTIFSLGPLLIIAIMIVGAVFGEAAVRGEVVGQIQQAVGEEGAQFIETAIVNLREEPAGGPLRWVLGVGFLAFGASGFFIQLQQALNRIWEVKPEPGRQVKLFLRKRLLSFSMVLIIAVLVLLSILANAALAMLIDVLTEISPLWAYLSRPLSFLITLTLITLFITAIFMILPDAKVVRRDALIGATCTAVLFMLGQYLFGLFLDQTNFGSAYGFASSVVILITWIYYSAHIFFFGADLTQVYARQHGHAIVPEDHAISTADRARSSSEESSSPGNRARSQASS